MAEFKSVSFITDRQSRSAHVGDVVRFMPQDITEAVNGIIISFTPDQEAYPLLVAWVVWAYCDGYRVEYIRTGRFELVLLADGTKPEAGAV
jgi:hypothetical protein